QPAASLLARTHPLAVFPLIGRRGDDRRGQRRNLEAQPERIDLDQDMAFAGAKLELVVVPLARRRNEDLPYAARAQGPHGMAASVPVVEVADDADALGVGRPDSEVHPGGRSDPHGMRAELLVNAGVIAL